VQVFIDEKCSINQIVCPALEIPRDNDNLKMFISEPKSEVYYVSVYSSQVDNHLGRGVSMKAVLESSHVLARFICPSRDRGESSFVNLLRQPFCLHTSPVRRYTSTTVAFARLEVLHNSIPFVAIQLFCDFNSFCTHSNIPNTAFTMDVELYVYDLSQVSICS
jgi:hypothetical protein